MARDILMLGATGSGKTQGIRLCWLPRHRRPDPLITFAKCAAVTRHLVGLHDPTSAAELHYNLVEASTMCLTYGRLLICW